MQPVGWVSATLVVGLGIGTGVAAEALPALADEVAPAVLLAEADDSLVALDEQPPATIIAATPSPQIAVTFPDFTLTAIIAPTRLDSGRNPHRPHAAYFER